MNQKTYQQLQDINAQLLDICDWLNRKHDVETASKLIPVVSELTVLVAAMDMEKT